MRNPEAHQVKIHFKMGSALTSAASLGKMSRRLVRKNPEILLGAILGILCAYRQQLWQPEECWDAEPAKSYGKIDSYPDKPSVFSPLPRPKHTATDDYEPVVLSPNAKTLADQNAPKPARPRYYASELGIHETLYVAISSSENTIRTLGTAVNRTSAQYLPRISFFLNSIAVEKFPEFKNLSMNIIRSSDHSQVFNPIVMLKFLIENHIEAFDWFFISPETTYIRGKDLMEYVQKISVGKKFYIGVPVDEKTGSYCDFEAGILIGQALLRSIAEALPWCLDMGRSTDGTTAVGRCVEKAAQLKCNQEYQGQLFQTFRISEQHPLDDQEQTAELVQSSERLRSALTVYTLSGPEQFYRLHLELNKNKLAETESLIEELQEDFVSQSLKTPNRGIDLHWPIGVNSQSVPKDRFDVIEWTYFNSTHMLRPDDFFVAKRLTGSHLRDINNVVEFSKNLLEERYSQNELKSVDVVNGYRRFDAARGMEYLLDLELRTEETGNGQSKSTRKRIKLLKPLGKMEPIPMPFVTENTRVHVTLPVKGSEIGLAQTFLKRFADTLLESLDNVFLMMVLVYGMKDAGKDDPGDIFLPIKRDAKEIEKRFSKSLGTRLGWLSVRNPTATALPDFAVMDLVSKKFTKDSIVLFSTVNGILSGDFLNRVRLTTIAGWQVYFPMPFVQYHPKVIYRILPRPDEFDVKRQLGHFDRHSTEFAAFYVMDYMSARKLTADAWPLINSDHDLLKYFPLQSGESAVFDIYSLFLNSDLHVFRAVEPMLTAKFSIPMCDKKRMNRQIYDQCETRLAESVASKQQLQDFLTDAERNAVPRVSVLIKTK